MKRVNLFNFWGVKKLGIHDKEGNYIDSLPIEVNIIKALKDKEKLEKEKERRLSLISKAFIKK